jgi:integrase
MHTGHGRSCCWLEPVGDDPEQTSKALPAFRGSQCEYLPFYLPRWHSADRPLLPIWPPRCRSRRRPLRRPIADRLLCRHQRRLQLVDLGIELMEECRITANAPITMTDAVQYRDGLIIALFGYVPLRHKNFAALAIGRDLIKEDDHWFIVIPPEETKTRTYIEFQVPDTLRVQFSAYLILVRPRMLRRPGCKALWVSPKGGPLSYSAIGPVITRHTTKRLGIRITPHDARDAAATTWAIAAPQHIGVSRDLLAHSDLRTTTKYYNRAKGIEASRAHSQLIARLRRKPRPPWH